MNDTSAKKDTQKLQRIVVDALEDVKAQEIVVFDKVKEAGYAKPRIEGEDNGEWIIVDCGSVVAHVMQPTIRSYYNLEEIWGDKPVRLKLGAPKPAEPVRKPVAKKKANVSAGRTPTRRDSVPVGPMGSEALKPTRKVPVKSSGKPAAKSAGKAPAKSSSKPVSKSVGKPAAKSSSKPASKPASKVAPKAASKSSAKAKPKA
jgi:ribosome-associated protein